MRWQFVAIALKQLEATKRNASLSPLALQPARRCVCTPLAGRVSFRMHRVPAPGRHVFHVPIDNLMLPDFCVMHARHMSDSPAPGPIIDAPGLFVIFPRRSRDESRADYNTDDTCFDHDVERGNSRRRIRGFFSYIPGARGNFASFIYDAPSIAGERRKTGQLRSGSPCFSRSLCLLIIILAEYINRECVRSRRGPGARATSRPPVWR